MNTWIRRLYVPLSAVVILVGVNYYYSLSQPSTFDPIAAAQNPRIRFQTGGEVKQSSNAQALSADEVILADSVLKQNSNKMPEANVLVYMGNSQTMAIMDRLPGDMISAQWLQVLLVRDPILTKQSFRVTLASLPNLTMTEFLIKLIVSAQYVPRQIDIMVGGIVLQGFRELGIRGDVVAMTQQPKVKATLTRLVSENHDLKFAAKALTGLNKEEDTLGNQAPSDKRTKHGFSSTVIEASLQRWAGHIPLFAMRGNLRAQINLRYYEWRNRLLGIKTATSRPVPEATYRTNLELLEMALRYVKAANIHTVLYLAPIRPIQPNPNLSIDIERFRLDVPILCQRYGITCLDYVNLIPEDLWTNYPDNDDAPGTRGQRDFAHFTGAAHRLVAARLLSDIREQLQMWTSKRTEGSASGGRP